MTVNPATLNARQLQTWTILKIIPRLATPTRWKV
jgi:hypothetical protein